MFLALVLRMSDDQRWVAGATVLVGLVLLYKGLPKSETI